MLFQGKILQSFLSKFYITLAWKFVLIERLDETFPERLAYGYGACFRIRQYPWIVGDLVLYQLRRYSNESTHSFLNFTRVSSKIGCQKSVFCYFY